MRRSLLSRAASPELLFGVLQTLVWLLLAFQVSLGVLSPLAHTLDRADALHLVAD